MAFLTLQQKRNELESLATFLNDIDLSAEVIDAAEESEDKLLLVEFPGKDGPAQTMEELERVLIGRIIQLPEEEVYTKYLMLYTQIPAELEDKDELSILKLLNEWNRKAFTGSFFYSKEDGDETCQIQYKALIASADDEPFDEGVVGETIINFGMIYEEVKEAFEKL